MSENNMTRTTVQNTALRAEAAASAQALLHAENVAGVWIELPGTPPQVLMAGDVTAMAGLLMRNDPKAADHLAREAGFYIGLRDLDRAWIGVNASGLVSMFFKEAPRAEDYPELLILDFVRSGAAQAAPVVAASELTDEEILELDCLRLTMSDDMTEIAVASSSVIEFARLIERTVLAAAAPAASVAVPAGYALVPVEPTDEMRAATKHLAYASHIGEDWAAMLAAAPATPAAQAQQTAGDSDGVMRGMLLEAREIFDLMLCGDRELIFGDYQNGDGETIGPRMDALHALLRSVNFLPPAPGLMEAE